MTEASTIMPTKSKSSTASARKSRRQTEPLPVEAGATGLASCTASSFTIGDRVTHHMFGDGTVEAVRDHKLRIKFETVGSKEILSSFITRPR
jgi:DNA helicase-2/ATP-dependent DNA helicase PcrA